MLIKTNELTGAALDYAVAIAEGFVSDGDKQDTELWLEHPDYRCGYSGKYNYSSEWNLGGQIIEREQLYIQPTGDAAKWKAYQWLKKSNEEGNFGKEAYGETALITAMRCYVVSKFGNEIEIPDCLLQGKSHAIVLLKKSRVIKKAALSFSEEKAVLSVQKEKAALSRKPCCGFIRWKVRGAGTVGKPYVSLRSLRFRLVNAHLLVSKHLHGISYT